MTLDTRMGSTSVTAMTCLNDTHYNDQMLSRFPCNTLV